MHRRLLLVPLALGVLAVTVPPAGAVSCAPHVDGSPVAIAAGTEQLATDGGFFDRWHHLMLGRVVGVATDGDELSSTFGRTTWTVDVVAALGSGDVPRRVVLLAPDDGGSGGYPFRLGQAYAIPVSDIEWLGPWSSHMCDPVTVLDDLGAAAERVLAVAAVHGTPVATMSGAAPSELAGAVQADAAPEAGPAPMAAAALVLASAGGALALWLRSRREAQPTR